MHERGTLSTTRKREYVHSSDRKIIIRFIVRIVRGTRQYARRLLRPCRIYYEVNYEPTRDTGVRSVPYSSRRLSVANLPRVRKRTAGRTVSAWSGRINPFTYLTARRRR